MIVGYARSAGLERTATFSQVEAADEWKRQMQRAHFHVTVVTADPRRLEPCGYCRRCAVHDDPGGCLTVEAYEREIGLRP